jgi:hypothetical protein
MPPCKSLQLRFQNVAIAGQSRESLPVLSVYCNITLQQHQHSRVCIF